MLADVDGDGARLLRHAPAPHRPHAPATPTRWSTTPPGWSSTTATTAPATGPFNTAYAATLVAGDAFVTRLRDLREAERFIAAGIPLVVSIAFGRNQLAGAPISASNGHLLVVVGFEPDGDVVVNDPAARTNAEVRRVYDRAQFERIWLAGLRRHGVRHPQRAEADDSTGSGRR